jgi:transcriptional regulator with XRE-family HTH domain
MEYGKSHTELGSYLTDLVGSKLSNSQIADALGVSRSAVTYWMTGQRHPEQPHLHKLCGLLQTSLEDVETAYTLAGYYLTPEQVAQVNAWQPADQHSPALETYNDLTSWLSAIRGSKSGIELEVGLRSAKNLVRRLQRLIEEGAHASLLGLYFDALDELTQFQNLLTPPKNLKYDDLPFYEKMQDICDQTKDKRLLARLLASQGDEEYVLGKYRASYSKLKSIVDNPSVVDPALYIRPILRSSCLSLSYPHVGSDAEFHRLANLLEDAIHKYANTINPMLIVLGLEGQSRAYANRYEHTRKKEYKDLARQKLEEAETLTNQSTGYPIFGLRVRKARLRLAHMGVLEGISLTDQAAEAREVKKLFGQMGEFRSVKDIDDILVKIEC